MLFWEMLFADDWQRIALSEEDIQKLEDAFANAASEFNLKIDIKKSECLSTCQKAPTQSVNQQTPEKIPLPSSALLSLKTARRDNEIIHRLTNRFQWHVNPSRVIFGQEFKNCNHNYIFDVVS